ncbi:hypothetical protein D3C85_980120 [compost metagenome]
MATTWLGAGASPLPRALGTNAKVRPRSFRLNGLATKTRQLDVSSTASVEVEFLRAAWAAMINERLMRADLPGQGGSPEL